MKHIMDRLPKDADLLESLTKLCEENGIKRGSVQVIGALQQAELAYYRQDEQKYIHHTVAEEVELISGLGNVSIKDGRPFVHLHLVLSRENGECIAGHACPGCTIFASEAIIMELEGPDLVRELDTPTGLPLWRKD